jgi:acetyl-CoA acetyltransferase
VTEVYIGGTGMTRFGRHPGQTVRTQAQDAVREALTDAGLEAGDVGMVFFANAVGGLITGQEMIRGQAALRNTGLLGVPIVNVENACASASSALHLARMAVASGSVDVALAVGSEKMTHQDKTRTFAALQTALDLEQLDDLAQLIGGGEETSTGVRSIFMDIYATIARQYMDSSGATAEDFARVTVKNHRHGELNPRAQYGSRLTVQDVLNSRRIVDPLTLLMCSPISDGAAAVLVCSDTAARRIDARVRIRASVLLSGRDRTVGDASAIVRAAQMAYEASGIGPDDLDVVELHDAAAPAELAASEDMGLCPPGDGPKLLASGDSTLGGKLPINPSGGLLAKGHPIGATGCAQIVELADQLRGRCGPRQVTGARIALAENGGGFLYHELADPAAAAVTILSLERRGDG